MSTLNEFRGISIGDRIVCIGILENGNKFHAFEKEGIIEKIKIDEGAESVWYEGKFDDGGTFLFTGDEIRKV